MAYGEIHPLKSQYEYFDSLPGYALVPWNSAGNNENYVVYGENTSDMSIAIFHVSDMSDRHVNRLDQKFIT